jgi:hypothetical protein
MDALNAPSRRIVFIGTGGVLDDPERAAHLRDLRLPPTAVEGLTTIVLDLSGMDPTTAALREIIVPLGQRLRGGVYGTMKLIVATPNEAIAEFVGLLAGAHGFPIYLAASSSGDDVARARPAGGLTETEQQTLHELWDSGGWATVADLAGRFGIETTAVNNRLTNLDRKGYIHRYRRPRRYGDIYLDPRAPVPTRDALRAHGITTDPYDRSPLRLDGQAAARAAEILKRRASQDD